MTQLAERPRLSLAELEAFDPNARQTGREIRFLCPLGACGEGKRADTRHRSLSVNLESGLWVCQRCKASGKIREKWAPREHEHLSPRARARRAFGLDSRPSSPHHTPNTAAIAAHISPTAAAADATPAKLPAWRRMWDQAPAVADTPGADYLRSRGIPIETAAAAGVRFVERWAHWTRDQASAWQLEATSRRVVFPIQDQVGDLVGIQGRAIDLRHAGEKVITRGSAGIFSTVGLPTLLGRGPRVVLVEAPIDALSLAVAGTDALSLQGTTWPDWLLRALAFGTALLGFDNDEPDAHGDRAGDIAAARLTSELRAFGVDVARRRPTRKDWNELLVERGARQVGIEIDAEAWDQEIADKLLDRTLQRIASFAGALDAESEGWQTLEDQVNACYQQRHLAGLRAALEDYAAVVASVRAS